MSRRTRQSGLDDPLRGPRAATIDAEWSNDGDGSDAPGTTEAIDIHLDQHDGHLRIECDDEAFVYLRDLVLYGASAADRLGPFMESLESVVVRRRAAVRESATGRFRRHSVTLLVSLALSAAAAIQLVGIVAIARWFLGAGA